MKDHHQVPAGLEPVSYYTGAVEAFCEMVAGGLKPLALSAPLEPELASQVRVYVEQSIKKYDLVLYEEKDFPQTALSPRESVKGKIIFRLCCGGRNGCIRGTAPAARLARKDLIVSAGRSNPHFMHVPRIHHGADVRGRWNPWTQAHLSDRPRQLLWRRPGRR